MRTTAALLATFMLSRYAVSVDSTETSRPNTIIELLVGTGSYVEVTRDCSGNVISTRDVPYSEYGISASHTFSVVKVGVSGGVTNAVPTAGMFSSNDQTNSSFPYIAPQIGLNTKYFGMDVGYLFDLSKSPSQSPDFPYPPVEQGTAGTPIGGLRIGRLDRTYFYADYGLQLPLSVGSGFCGMGVGFGSSTTGPRYCLGIGAIPGEALMFSARGDFPISEHFVMCARGHIAPGEGLGYGGAAGLKVRF